MFCFFASLGKSSRSSTPDIQNSECEDPGKYLGQTVDMETEESDMDNNQVVVAPSEDVKYAIQSLAIALVQVAQAVDSKYLKRPLGGTYTRNWSILFFNARNF